MSELNLDALTTTALGWVRYGTSSSDVRFGRDVLALIKQVEMQQQWRPISEAPRDGTPIWACFHDDERVCSPYEEWRGVQMPLFCKRGVWHTAIPLGLVTFTDEWIAGWMPLPEPPSQRPEPTPSEPDESPGDFIARVGMDARKWAPEFRKTALRMGYSDMDEEWLISWFANAIMAGYDRAMSQVADRVRELEAQLKAENASASEPAGDRVTWFVGALP